jgi:cell division protein FtsI (penicillin-binding protein 3)
MDNNWQRPLRLHWVLGAAFSAAFVLLVGWLVHIPYMTVDGPDGRLTLAEKTARQQTQRLTVEPLRGPIVDARLRPLVITTEAYDIFADPQLVQEGRPEPGASRAAAKTETALGPTAGLQAALFLDRGYAANRARAAEQLGPLLHLEPGEIDRLIAEHPDKHFVYLKRRVDRETRDQIEALRLWGIGNVSDGKRNHPAGQLAVHVLGTTGYDNEGTDKLELSQDRRLRGESGHRNVEMDGHRRMIWIDPEGFQPVQDGQVLQLTLDMAVQSFAEEAIRDAVAKYRAKGASCLVMDPQSCEVLAMANYPTFNPDDFAKAPAYAVRNRLLTDPYEPGSTFKSFISSVALEEGVVHKGEQFDCTGPYCVNGRRLTDSHPYGMLTFENVVIKSSNIGMAKIGIRMGNDRLYEAVKRFGFGEPTGLGLPGEGHGQVHPLHKWTKLSASSIPMGYEVLVTPLQMVTAWCAIANGGTLLKPHLLKAVYGADGRLVEDLAVPAPVRRVLRQDTADYMRREVFRGVVLDGTGRDAFKGCPYRVFGKTGTAKKRDPHGKGYSSDLFVGSFIGGAPLEHPRLVVFVSLDEPDRSLAYYGGTVAAPAVREILEKSLGYLHVPADQTEPTPTQLASAHGH